MMYNRENPHFLVCPPDKFIHLWSNIFLSNLFFKTFKLFSSLSVGPSFTLTETHRMKYSSVNSIYIDVYSSGVPRNFVRREGVSINAVEDRGQRERGSWGSSPLVRGSGGSCNLVRTRNFISYSKIYLIFGTLRLFMMITNLFVIANVKQLRT